MPASTRGQKSPLALILTISSWGAVCVCAWQFYRTTIPGAYGPVLALGMKGLFLPWSLFWLWGLYYCWHSLLSILAPEGMPQLSEKSFQDEPVAILYTTCDDFDPLACQSLLNQSHGNTRLIICDDSRSPTYRHSIDNWVKHCGQRVRVVRRPERRGFKAGNLNFAISSVVREEFMVLCDADEVLPHDFVAGLLPYFQGSRVAFVQAAHKARGGTSSRFASLLGPSVDILYRYFLPSRNRFGFVPLFGHGAIIRRSVWSLVGGFPEIVAEDIGFAARASAMGWHGVYAGNVVAEEEFPPTYAAFVSKYCKDVIGTVQFFQTEYPRLLRSPEVTLVEKFDALMMFSSCYLGLITLINIMGSLFLSYVYKIQGFSNLEAWLFVLYIIGPFTPILALIILFCKSPRKYVLYYFISALAFVSIIPRLALTAILQSFKLSQPIFNATGHIARQKQKLYQHIPVQCLGLAFFVLAAILRTAIFIPITGLSLMLFFGPFLSFANENGIIGSLVTYSSLVPFLFMGGLWILQ
jgi:cellulose synthase/poly-beta-1,6-N-acetylglucosamine synthase-like glycosyltransferase